MRRFLLWMVVVCFLSDLSAQAAPVAQAEPRVSFSRTEPWPEEVLEAVAHLPIQEGGRIKPLDTFAQFQLLTLNGRRSFKREWQEDGKDRSESLSAVAWMLDCMFFPDQAWDYEVVVIDDVRIVQAIGLDVEGKKRRDRYSLTELSPGFARLGQMGQKLAAKASDERSGLDNQILNLARKLPRLRDLIGYLDFTRERYDLAEVKALAPLFPGRASITMMELIAEFDKARSVLSGGHNTDPQLSRLLDSITTSVRFASYLSFLPPAARQVEAYDSPEAVLIEQLQTGKAGPGQWQALEQLTALMGQRRDFAELSTGIVAFCQMMTQRVEARGEGGKIAMEVEFYRADQFYYSVIYLLVGFLISTGTWFLFGWERSAARGRRLAHRLVFWAAMLPILYGEYLIIAGITSRCILKDRPPITTPYEAMLFAVGLAILLLLFVEVAFKNGLAMSGAALFGAVGMRVSVWQESADAVDTMQPLVAVLDTNFWLSTHVTMITTGYMAAWAAAFVAHFYILFKFLALFGIWEKTKLCHYVSRVIYGILCFGLVFSLGGTILGGVWANDSWGRFWGWDPKENGALMLVLVFIFILHARMGGYLREFGLALGALVTGITSFWAFWGVNLLQIGLHSYGFDEQKAYAWSMVQWVEWSCFLLGAAIWGAHRIRQRFKLAA